MAQTCVVAASFALLCCMFPSWRQAVYQLEASLNFHLCTRVKRVSELRKDCNTTHLPRLGAESGPTTARIHPCLTASQLIAP